MDNSTTSQSETCPTPPGFRELGGLLGQPGFSFINALEHPTYNWHVIGWFVCLLLVIITWACALTTVWKHLTNYSDPQIQQHKARVLLYPPVFATLACVSYLRYDYSTTVMFFATLFEAFAVYNLYECLQAYLKPFREAKAYEEKMKGEKIKEPGDFKLLLCCCPRTITSKWGMHYSVITSVLVFQYPIWSIFEAIISIVTQRKGYYCEGSYSIHGAYLYLTILNFAFLSAILSALIIYLTVFKKEWKDGGIPAHAMFWCVKGPIMFIFYFGDILLTILVTADVIKGTDGTHSNDGLAWPASAVKNGIQVIITCAVMCVTSLFMIKYYGYKDHHWDTKNAAKQSVWAAITECYLYYPWRFLQGVVGCCVGSCKLGKKRSELKKRKNPTADDPLMRDMEMAAR